MERRAGWTTIRAYNEPRWQEEFAADPRAWERNGSLPPPSWLCRRAFADNRRARLRYKRAMRTMWLWDGYGSREMREWMRRNLRKI